MANAIYPLWLEGLLQGVANSALTGTVKATLVDLAEHLAARVNCPLESDEGVPVADMVHWCHPSAEMVAESREAEL